MRKERLFAKRYLVYEIGLFSREFQKYLSISTPRRKEGLINGFLRDNGGSPLKKAFFPESVNEKRVHIPPKLRWNLNMIAWQEAESSSTPSFSGSILIFWCVLGGSSQLVSGY